jgi:hypothetical protein
MMNTKRPRAASRPRTRLLARSLAAALAIGTGSAIAVPLSPQVEARIAQAVPDGMSAAERDEFIERAHRLQRTVPTVPANTITVLNCNDAGPGSLRQAAIDAVSGDTIDMSSLTCGTITLTTGAIAIGQADLTLQGPGALALAIDGNSSDRVLFHLGTGNLVVNDVMLQHGHKYVADDAGIGNAAGGCVFSAGSLTLDHTWSKYCDATSPDVNSPVRGGAVYAAGGVSLINSFVTASSATSTAFEARGGGVYSPTSLFMLDSSVSGNETTSPHGASGGGIAVGSLRDGGVTGSSTAIKYSTLSQNHSSLWGGAAYVTGSFLMQNSTVSANSACRSAGLYLLNTGTPAQILSSTISGNAASCGGAAAGISMWQSDLKLRDTTIAFNTSHAPEGATKYGTGVRMNQAHTLDLENTIIASNTVDQGSGPLADDTGGNDGATSTGSNNLVYLPSQFAMPGGTILLQDPLLRALANNGGTTLTHMPNFGSPVINAGNNVSGATVDQRGSGFPRIIGPSADIGAVEFTLVDVIFADGFDP